VAIYLWCIEIFLVQLYECEEKVHQKSVTIHTHWNLDNNMKPMMPHFFQFWKDISQFTTGFFQEYGTIFNFFLSAEHKF
jgi:hypothetical protein